MKKYHLVNQINYKSKKEYLENYLSKNIGQQEDLLFIDSSSYLGFLQKISADTDVIYLGCFINDSISFIKSITLHKNTSCKGRILDEINNNLSLNSDSIQNHLQKEILCDFNFIALNTGVAVHLNSNDQIKIILLFSSGFGSYYDDLYKQVYSMIRERQLKCKVYYLSIDPVYQLK